MISATLINLVKFILFADDTNVFCAGDNKLELECMLNRELAKFCRWFAVNKLSLNLSKTSYMLFRNRLPDVDFNVFIEHERINRVHVTKFLLMINLIGNTIYILLDQNYRKLLRSFIEQVA